MMLNSKKSQIWISAVLYILIISTSIVLLLKIGTPIIENFKEKSSFSKSKETMLTIDKIIQEVSNEGQGSQRILPIEIKDGEIKIKDNEISWEIESKTEIIDDRTSFDFGNLKITSNANVRTIEKNDKFLMQTEIEGDIFNVSIKKIGNPDNFSSINTSQLIENLYYDGNIVNGTFSFSINGDLSSSYGNGYTIMVPEGNNTNLGRAKVIAHINSSSFDYNLVFTLESFADFITVEIENIE